jgi:hypothetical protein
MVFESASAFRLMTGIAMPAPVFPRAGLPLFPETQKEAPGSSAARRRRNGAVLQAAYPLIALGIQQRGPGVFLQVANW